MRPGKPLAFGNFKGIPFIGLPGNPVSAFVGCLVFVLPVIRKLAGREPYQHRLVAAGWPKRLNPMAGKVTCAPSLKKDLRDPQFLWPVTRDRQIYLHWRKQMLY